MQVAVVYLCVPGNSELETCAERFARTYLEFPPLFKHELIVSTGTPYKSDMKPSRQDILFRGLEYRPFGKVNSGGFEIGDHQEVTHHLRHDFVLFCNSRTHFHREGWLKRLVDERVKHGDGLYGSTGSYEACPLRPSNAPNPHIRTPFFACNPAVYRKYPHTVNCREVAYHAESGDINLTSWFATSGYPVIMVTFDGSYTQPDWRKPENCFRKGDQSNLLAFDRHSQIYAQSNPASQMLLRAAADGRPIRHVPRGNSHRTPFRPER